MSGKTLKASVLIGGSITGAFRSALSTTKTGLREIGEAIVAVDKRQRLMAQSINTFARQGKNVDSLRVKYAALVTQSERLRAAQQRLAKVQSAIDANSAKRASLRGAMFDTVATAAVIGVPIRAAVKFEDAMLGVAKQVEGARDKSGKLTAVYFDMARQIQGLGREIPMATNDLAKMVEAGARMGIARDELIKFTRTASMMATAFDQDAGELADSMGKVAGIFKIPISEIEALGDAINYLDDNAISKGGDIIKVLQGDLAGAASTMGLSVKNAAALASTLLTLGESAERADTAASGMLRQLQIAKMNPKKFQMGVSMIGMTSDQLQKGMIADTQGTILKVLDKIKALPKDKQMEAVTRLFGKDWGGAIAKLAGGVDEYRRQLELANGEANKGSMSREFQARLQTTSAQWQIMKNRLTEMAVAIGGALLPALNEMMTTVGPVVTRFAEWAKANPKLVKGVIGTAAALTSLRAATIAVGWAWTFIKAPVLQVMGFIARWRAAGAMNALGRFGGVALRVAGVFRWVGTALAAIGGGPVAIALAALVGAAILVRKYWEPIKAFFIGVWEGFKNAAGPALDTIMQALQPLKPAWDAIAGAVGAAWDWLMKLIEPAEYTSGELNKVAAIGRIVGEVLANSFQIGATVIAVVIKAVTWLGTAIGETAGWIVVHFTKAWDIVKNSAAAAFEWIMAKIQPVLNAIGWVVGKATEGFNIAVNAVKSGKDPAALAMSGNAPKIVAGGRALPAIAAPRTAAASTTANTFNITQQPGESQEALARRIIDEQERRKGAKSRGSLADKVD